MNKTRSDRIEDLSSTLTYIELTLVVTVMIVLCLMTIIGNALVLISFAVDRKLRTLSNYFLLSLAISDVMIATFSMPLTIVYVLIGEWNLGRTVCNMWLAQDYICSNASVLNLLMIAVDRYYSVTNPLKYRAKRTAKRVWSMIAFVWVISFLLYPPWIYAWPYIEGRDVVPEDDCYVQFLETNIVLTVVMVVLDYYIPTSVILILYYRIWRETRRRSRYLADMKGGCQSESVCLQTLDSPPCKNKKQRRSPKTIHASHSNGNADPVGTVPFTDRESQSTLDRKPESMCLLPQNSSCENNKQRSLSPKTIRASHSNGNSDCCDPELEGGTVSLTDNGLESDPKSESMYLRPENSPPLEKNRQGSQSPKSTLTDNELDSVTTDNKSVAGEYPDSKVSDVDSTLSDHSVQPKTSASQKGDGTKPDKAARVLTVILCAFFVTSFPYNVTVIIKNLDSSQTLISDAVFTFCYYLFYVNSTLNPFCYALANENFRRTYWRIVTCSWSRNPAGTYSVASYSSKSSEGKISCNARHVTSPV